MPINEMPQAIPLWKEQRVSLWYCPWWGWGVRLLQPEGGGSGGWTMEMSLLHRALLVIDLVQMGQLHKSALLEVSRTMPWRQLQHWALEPAQLGLRSGHQLVLGAKETKVPTNIIAQRRSQSYSEAMPGGRYYPSPSKALNGEGRHMVSESGVNGFHFPHPSTHVWWG